MSDANAPKSTTTPHQWNTLVDYEKGDVILSLFKKLSCSLFQKDSLHLVERESYECHGSDPIFSTNSLVLYGQVGYIRREALLHVIRYARLRQVSDFASCVAIGHVTLDLVPHMFLEPLNPCLHTDAYRRWYRCHHAMRAGLLYKINAQRAMTKERLQRIVEESTRPPNATAVFPNPTQSSDDPVLNGQTFREFFRDLQHEAPGKTFAPLDDYYNALMEERIDMARIAAAVPTVFVPWSYQYPESLEWLEDRVFNDTYLQQLRAAERSASGKEIADPWLHFVESFVTVPPRRTVDRAVYHHTFIPPYSKRAQIVLVCMDADCAPSREAYTKLLEQCGGWRSNEVDVLSLWAGPKGFHSEFATQFNVRQVPFVIGTTPAKRDYHTFKLSKPFITYIPQVYSKKGELLPVIMHAAPPKFEEEEEAEAAAKWHSLTPSERASLTSAMHSFMLSVSASLSFSASVTKHFIVCNPYTEVSTKALRARQLSRVVLRGNMSDADVRRARKMWHQLIALENFHYLGQIIQSSIPLTITLLPPTPRRYVRGATPVIACSGCQQHIPIETAPHYHCIQCTQSDGCFCQSCFEAKVHPMHHLLLRVPPGITDLCIPLLWGPSNVTPLRCIQGQVLRAQTPIHAGIHCNRCFNPVKGIRWKCAVCHEYDLCENCFTKRMRKEKDGIEEVRAGTYEAMRCHLPTHPFLCIPFPRRTNAEEFLEPKKIFTSIHEFLEQDTA
ncbi:hypothetical protein STCU_05629 [Strigomonas culicis]|uniref:ZZ-type domain-containing protein n=1 Tax=Strigomonas culicis TaxID=28005 RepID=S9VKS3_9TRYP|nr:hypothetical protein STCU_05629 [Strigomonas culicis]|eukprot:EPY27681.1 hypothetical protein STCU_05629 [Strigomonas culicis]